MSPSDQIQRLLRAYRAATMIQDVRQGHQKIKNIFDKHSNQSNSIMDAADLSGRIIRKKVQPEDVRSLGKIAVKSAPRVYEIVARHVQRQKNAKA